MKISAAIKRVLEKDRIEVGRWKLITARGAAELLGINRDSVTRLAKTVWPAFKLGGAWLIDYGAVLSYRGPLGTGQPPPRLGQGRQYKHLLPRQEIIETRPGVLTTAPSIQGRYKISTSVTGRLIECGLPAQRVGKVTLIYEDDWEAFLWYEWERPRLKRPFALRKPKGVKLGPIITHPHLGVPKAEWKRGKFAGWTFYYSKLMEQGKAPPDPYPLSDSIRKKRGLPTASVVFGRKTPKPKEIVPGVDRLKVGRQHFVTVRGAAQILSLSLARAQNLVQEWGGIKFVAIWLTEKKNVVRWRKNLSPIYGHGKGPQHEKPNTFNYSLPKREELRTRPGVLITARALARKLGTSPTNIYRLIRRGLPAIRIGRETVIYENEVKIDTSHVPFTWSYKRKKQRGKGRKSNK